MRERRRTTRPSRPGSTAGCSPTPCGARRRPRRGGCRGPCPGQPACSGGRGVRPEGPATQGTGDGKEPPVAWQEGGRGRGGGRRGRSKGSGAGWGKERGHSRGEGEGERTAGVETRGGRHGVASHSLAQAGRQAKLQAGRPRRCLQQRSRAPLSRSLISATEPPLVAPQSRRERVQTKSYPRERGEKRPPASPPPPSPPAAPPASPAGPPAAATAPPPACARAPPEAPPPSRSSCAAASPPQTPYAPSEGTA